MRPRTSARAILVLHLLFLAITAAATPARCSPAAPAASAEDLNAALRQAVREGNPVRVETLLTKGANPNTRDELSSTPLINAIVWHGDANIVRFLLVHGADVNAAGGYGKTALMWLAVAYIEDAYNPEILRLLLDAGADVRARTPYGESVFVDAVAGEHLKMVSALLDRGADVNARSDRPDRGPSGGAAPGAGSSEAGYTGLMCAARTGQNEMLRLLLEKGADTRARDDYGRTALIYAASYGESLGMVKALLQHGAEVNAQDKDGKTSLMLAAREGCAASVQALLAAGAHVNAKNRWGETALTYARQQRWTAVIRLLRKHGARG